MSEGYLSKYQRDKTLEIVRKYLKLNERSVRICIYGEVCKDFICVYKCI